MGLPGIAGVNMRVHDARQHEPLGRIEDALCADASVGLDRRYSLPFNDNVCGARVRPSNHALPAYDGAMIPFA
jgi:hypothetical protein